MSNSEPSHAYIAVQGRARGTEGRYARVEDARVAAHTRTKLEFHRVWLISFVKERKCGHARAHTAPTHHRDGARVRGIGNTGTYFSRLLALSWHARALLEITVERSPRRPSLTGR